MKTSFQAQEVRRTGLIRVLESDEAANERSLPMSEQLEAMRAEFEAWAESQAGDDIQLGKAVWGVNVVYMHSHTQALWIGYQAASAQLSKLRESHQRLMEAAQSLINAASSGSKGDIPPSARNGYRTDKLGVHFDGLVSALSQAKELGHA